VTYDAEQDPDPQAWLEADELERIALVQAFHRDRGIHLPNLRLHAAIHVVIENQLAMGERDVVEALARLQRDGLSRHDAVHAIGMVVSEQLFEAMKAPSGTNRRENLGPGYLERIRQLTVQEWLDSAGG
jgi:hypothetical protein